jgi:hypothetical protein
MATGRKPIRHERRHRGQTLARVLSLATTLSRSHAKSVKFARASASRAARFSVMRVLPVHSPTIPGAHACSERVALPEALRLPLRVSLVRSFQPVRAKAAKEPRRCCVRRWQDCANAQHSRSSVSVAMLVPKHRRASSGSTRLVKCGSASSPRAALREKAVIVRAPMGSLCRERNWIPSARLNQSF